MAISLIPKNLFIDNYPMSCFMFSSLCWILCIHNCFHIILYARFHRFLKICLYDYVLFCIRFLGIYILNYIKVKYIFYIKQFSRKVYYTFLKIFIYVKSWFLVWSGKMSQKQIGKRKLHPSVYHSHIYYIIYWPS